MKFFLVGVVMGALIAMVNNWSFEDEVLQQKLYCDMNSGGLWYDSQERYSKICPTEPSSESGSFEIRSQKDSGPQDVVIFTF